MSRERSTFIYKRLVHCPSESLLRCPSESLELLVYEALRLLVYEALYRERSTVEKTCPLSVRELKASYTSSLRPHILVASSPL